MNRRQLFSSLAAVATGALESPKDVLVPARLCVPALAGAAPYEEIIREEMENMIHDWMRDMALYGKAELTFAYES